MAKVIEKFQPKNDLNLYLKKLNCMTGGQTVVFADAAGGRVGGSSFYEQFVFINFDKPFNIPPTNIAS